jgi:phosphoglycolate phosphatase
MRLELELKPLALEFYRTWISHGAADLISNSLNVSLDEVTPYVGNFRERYRQLPTPRSSVYFGVVDTISNLSEQGKKIGLCSNKPEYLCQKIINEIGLSDFISVIVGGDTLPTSKPCRDPIDYVIKELEGASSSTIFIGDSSIDQRASAAANVPFVFYSGGYNDGVNQAYVQYSITEIPQLLTLDFSNHFPTVAH